MNASLDVTLVDGAIHNPDEPRHFMTVTSVAGTATATIGGEEIARSDDAVVVREVGRAIYDPVVYFPRADVHLDALVGIDRTTHCPLKGDTEYFDVVTTNARAEGAAWSYVEMALGDELKHLIAFDAAQVTVDRQ